MFATHYPAREALIVRALSRITRLGSAGIRNLSIGAHASNWRFRVIHKIGTIRRRAWDIRGESPQKKACFACT
jgi:hypothetical protein